MSSGLCCSVIAIVFMHLLAHGVLLRLVLTLWLAILFGLTLIDQ